VMLCRVGENKTKVKNQSSVIAQHRPVLRLRRPSFEPGGANPRKAPRPSSPPRLAEGRARYVFGPAAVCDEPTQSCTPDRGANGRHRESTSRFPLPRR
jgi:hypothetical protein